MQVSHGPPGQKGISFLMAVGADDLPSSPLERATSRAAVAGLSLALVGLFTGSRVMRDVGAGAAAAGGVLYLVGRRSRTVIAS